LVCNCKHPGLHFHRHLSLWCSSAVVAQFRHPMYLVSYGPRSRHTWLHIVVPILFVSFSSFNLRSRLNSKTLTDLLEHIPDMHWSPRS
jgi:hypothetical protein